MYEFLFPHQSFKAKQALQNPSDMIKLNETSQMGLPFAETMTDLTGLSPNISGHPSVNQTLFIGQRSYNDTIDQSVGHFQDEHRQHQQSLHLRFKSSTLPTITPAMISQRSDQGVDQIKLKPKFNNSPWKVKNPNSIHKCPMQTERYPKSSFNSFLI